ncbi:MAG: HK97-gp10 family putative phage morphogenesis protein [Parvibaculaceae bacterium]
MATVLGLTKLERKLNRLPVAAKAKIKAAMEEGANQIVAMMKSLVPVDKGTLRDSIGWTWGRAPKGASIIAVAKSKIGAEMTITIYAGSDEAYYARWQEFGTQTAPAHPYFYVSWRANRKEVRGRIRRATREAATQVAAGR